ncbi:Glutamate--tRNA ligase [Candidatus Portiera aleyrodidarum]|uniref:Glutamate--tRNA ligase n=1 Tax=Candidatus Portiera aleyrodidarum TV TaxID=1297582 RepID=A0A8D3X6S8_9GAMM|nr:glutamate--tRNA ligase [Candidatus Portiera aleyrodidarum]AGI27076.1 glutamyl-tRNA synthetase [Candidatus Portiera aleyrodidarum TV]CEI59039.1 Glutamate--tRNA ligase [Candidatus Portiera aleyrodidarum]
MDKTFKTPLRTRIAPSPTGEPHIGTAYIALLNFYFARINNGKVILRIEDTDRLRSKSKFEKKILELLHWLGIQWDEGPDIGGNFGPYRQSERNSIYNKYVEKLINSGKVFKCYRTSEELEKLRKGKFDKALKEKDLQLDYKELKLRKKNNWPYVIRLKVPKEGICVFYDVLRGSIKMNWDQVDSQILIKSDGTPTYHLANVVDDYLMGITNVIRGEEWINSTPKHKLIYEYLGWPTPEFCHLPLLRNPDRSKLSKRKQNNSIEYYRKMGYLPQTIINYLGSIGGIKNTKFSIEDMQSKFDIKSISLGGPIFDLDKLTWLNGIYIRSMEDKKLIKVMYEWAKDYIYKILPSIKPRIKILTDIIPLSEHFFSGLPKLKAEDFKVIALKNTMQIKVLKFLWLQLEYIEKWDKATILYKVKQLSNHFKIKMKTILAPIFIAINGRLISTSVIDTIVIIGKDITIIRIKQAINILGGITLEQENKIIKEYQNKYANSLR